jgi:putative oxidoreductase
VRRWQVRFQEKQVTSFPNKRRGFRFIRFNDFAVDPIIQLHAGLARLLNQAGSYVGVLGLRLLLAREYCEAGTMKYRGDNWFAEYQNAFSFPFNLIPIDLSWYLATWTELLGAIALVIGQGTRFFSRSLIILTVVAWASVHAGNGYNVCDSGYMLH